MRAALLLLLVASTAHASPNDELSLGDTFRALRSSSANVLTDNNYFGGQLLFARQLPYVVLDPRIELWGTAGFGWGGADGEMFQTLTTDISTRTLTVGGRARYQPYTHLATSARIDLGTQRASLELTDGQGRKASDSGWGTYAAASVAVDLLATSSSSFSFGLRFEVGYVMTQGVALSPKSPHDDGTLSLAMSGASIGHLDLGGPAMGFSLLSQF